MSVKYAVLGLLIERPGYGYELIQRLGQRIGGWQPSMTVVYPTLRSLSQDQLIRRRDEPASHRSVVWYEATEAGVAEFHEWMHAPSELAPVREELMVKVALAQIPDLPRVIELTRELEQECLDRLVELSGPGDVEELLAREKDWDVMAGLLLREAEVAHLRTTMATLQRCRAAMKRFVRRQPVLDLADGGS